MLQLIQSLHNVSVANHTLYFSVLVLLASVVCPGWYKLGRLQVATVCSPAPTLAPARPRFVFHRQSYAILLLLANLIILG
jgi:hypothetical protein